MRKTGQRRVRKIVVLVEYNPLIRNRRNIGVGRAQSV
jgi:hypothetical protein